MKTDRGLLIATLVLVFIGYIMVISAHANVWIKFGALRFFFEIGKITVFIIMGIWLMNFTQKKFNIFKVMKKIRLISIVVALAMLATLLFPEHFGAKSWIRLPGFTIQPVEFLKITLVIFYAYHFGRHYRSNVSALNILKLPLIVLGVSFFFVFILQNDLGSAMIILIISLSIFMAIPEKKFTKIKLIVFVSIIVSIVLFYLFGSAISEYVYALPDDASFKRQLLRIATLFDPLRDVYNSGYQLTNSLVALSEGGLFGHGLGQSISKFIIPEPYNDAIIAVIAEEFGLFGISVIFGLYIFIVFKLLEYAKLEQISIYDRLMLIGIASFFMAQFFVNIGGIVGLIPMTGVTLLFISSGGSSILSAFLAIGIALGIIKRYRK